MIGFVTESQSNAMQNPHGFGNQNPLVATMCSGRACEGGEIEAR